MPAPPPEPYAVVTLTHRLSELEVHVLRALRTAEHDGLVRSVAAIVTNRDHDMVHAYRRLVVLGLIEEYAGMAATHTQFARITPAAERLLHTLSIENAHHFSPENPHETQR